jgi:hypothetical protein
MSIESQRKVASSVSSRLSGISAVLFAAVLFVAATQVCAGQTIIGSKRNHGFDIILLDSEVREAAFARGEDSTTSCIMGIPVGLLRSFGDWWHVCPENLLFPGDADTLFPLVQVFPSHGNFFHFLRPIAR